MQLIIIQNTIKQKSIYETYLARCERNDPLLHNRMKTEQKMNEEEMLF